MLLYMTVLGARLRMAWSYVFHLPFVPAQACHGVTSTSVCIYVTTAVILRFQFHFSCRYSHEIFVPVLYSLIHSYPDHCIPLTMTLFNGEYKYSSISLHRSSSTPFIPPLLHQTGTLVEKQCPKPWTGSFSRRVLGRERVNIYLQK
jgi:hypothetical protein